MHGGGGGRGGGGGVLLGGRGAMLGAGGGGGLHDSVQTKNSVLWGFAVLASACQRFDLKRSKFFF